MLNFSKSRLDSDLQNRTSVQHKVLCDWLRNISKQNTMLARRLTLIESQLNDCINPKRDPLEGVEDIEHGNLGNTESI